MGSVRRLDFKRECGPGRLEKSAETLEFDRIMLAVFVRKDFQELSISDSRGPNTGNQLIISSINQYKENYLVDGKVKQPKIERETYVFCFVSMLCNLMFFNRRI